MADQTDDAVLGARSDPSTNATEGATDDDRLDDALSTPNDTDTLTEDAQPHTPVKKTRSTDEQVIAFLAAVESGIGCREAATKCGLNLRTAYGILARGDADIDALRAATTRLLQVEALDRLDDWRNAARVGALKKGNHAPARDWLLHAGVIDALASDQGANVRIAICIGTDERPMKIASPLTTISSGLPPKDDE